MKYVGYISALIVVGAMSYMLGQQKIAACATEDAEGVLCLWDASERGNGEGTSFIVHGADVYYKQ